MNRFGAQATSLLGVILLVGACTNHSTRKREAEAIACGNQLNALHIAALGFGIDVGQESRAQLPRDLLSMSNEVNHPAILICPSDHLKRRATNWAALTPDKITYQVVTPGLSMVDTNGVWLKCPIHGFVIRPTGVFDGARPVRKQ